MQAGFSFLIVIINMLWTQIPVEIITRKEKKEILIYLLKSIFVGFNKAGVKSHSPHMKDIILIMNSG